MNCVVLSFLILTLTTALQPKCTKMSLGQPKPELDPWKEIEIDYSAVNEYVEAHYGEDSRLNPFFSNGKVRKETVMEPIYDGRKGVYDNVLGARREASLESCGFHLAKSPTRVKEWANKKEISTTYVRELEDVLSTCFPKDDLTHVVFWNPILRGEECEMSTRDDDHIPTSPVAGMVHIDTDVGAYESMEDLLNLVGNNRPDTSLPFEKDDILSAINDGHRFAIVNFWRNINSTPVKRAPLAVLHTKYKKDLASSTNASRYACFPDAAPDETLSNWYTFPDMTQDECLVFLQYDRLRSIPSDVWHCALPSVDSISTNLIPSRKSFDIRAFVVFEEKIPVELDRYNHARVRPLLNLEESGCFCDEQGEKRNRHS